MINKLQGIILLITAVLLTGCNEQMSAENQAKAIKECTDNGLEFRIKRNVFVNEWTVNSIYCVPKGTW